ncbi:hypothetical protein QBC43DRAFT_60976 [Cladorrhinum sp. PSN259]|nr:hypothetical protein QBC43DRAFT_60976 [Cladorrhinum sp. PSN259]
MAPAVPPPLPPSVEEAYRRKCIQLRQRTKEVDAENEAAMVRLARMQRQVDKMRLERAFLLEQLAKRTSTNVEDSDGSPSPPPTPKEKPLRLKRGHRKASILPNLEANASLGGGSSAGGAAGSTFINHNHHTRNTQSPSSDAFSTQPTNGLYSSRLGAPPREPSSAFNMYCDANRSSMAEKAEEADDGTSVEDRLESGWKDLDETKREEFETQADEAMAKYKKDRDAYDEAREKEEQEAAENGNKQQDAQDVEMTNYDTDDQETTQGGNGGGGSTAEKGEE